MLAALLFALAAELAGARKSRHSVPPRTTALPVSLNIASELPRMARQSMIDEVERIWRREGVRLHWTDSTRLRVVVVQAQPRLTSTTRHYGLAEFDRSRSLIVASLDSARRAVDEGLRANQMLGLAMRLQHVLGLVLGRVIAHEIGHYLLGNEHSTSGLMRAVFDARILVDPRASRAFELDDRNAAQLAEGVNDDTQAPVVSAD